MTTPYKYSPRDHRAAEDGSTEQPGQIQMLLRVICLMWSLLVLLLPVPATQTLGQTQRTNRNPRPTAVLHWFGGKCKLAKRIVALLPPHDLFIELCGGAMHVMFAKPASKIEVYNDLDKGLVNFFRVLADTIRHADLIDRVAGMPYSRSQYKDCKSSWQSCDDDVERAARWYVVARQAFAGLFGSTWGYGRRLNPAIAWAGAKRSLKVAHERIAHITIECDDWRVVLDRYDCPEALFYIDPPYVPAERKGGKFKCELTLRDHQDLVAKLLRIEGNAILSGYRTEVYIPLENAGWCRLEIDTVCTAEGWTRPTKLNVAGAVKARQRRRDCLWISPAISDYVLARAEAAGWTIAYRP